MATSYTGLFPGEDILPDDYPVHAGYCYVRKSGPCWEWFVSMVSGTVMDLKRDVETDTIRRCDMEARNLL